MLDNFVILDIDFTEINSFSDFFGFIVSGIFDLLQAIFDTFIFIGKLLLSLLTILPDRLEIIVTPFFTVFVIILLYRAWKG